MAVREGGKRRTTHLGCFDGIDHTSLEEDGSELSVTRKVSRRGASRDGSTVRDKWERERDRERESSPDERCDFSLSLDLLSHSHLDDPIQQTL
jgi:hypothetical protein